MGRRNEECAVNNRFTDRNGREWKLEANFASYGRVRDATGVKLYDIATENRESLVQLADALTLGQVLWAMVEPQAEAKGVTPEDFAESFDGEIVDAAYHALLEVMIFFCHPRQRKVLEIAVRKLREVEQMADKKVDSEMEGLEQEIDRAIGLWTSGLLATSLPGSSASTRANGPCENSPMQSAGDNERTGITPVPSSPN